jgi:hypothetical protein
MRTELVAAAFNIVATLGGPADSIISRPTRNQASQKLFNGYRSQNRQRIA